MLSNTLNALCSPFVGEADLEEDEREGSLAKVKSKPTGSQEEERGLTSLVHTTLHGDCCPLIMYRMVSVLCVWSEKKTIPTHPSVNWLLMLYLGGKVY